MDHGSSDSSDISRWPRPKLRARIEELKAEIGWFDTDGSARRWWQAFENENENRLTLVLQVVEELCLRGALIKDFFLAYVYSGVDNIQLNLDYYDHVRLLVKDPRALRPSDFLDEDGQPRRISACLH